MFFRLEIITVCIDGGEDDALEANLCNVFTSFSAILRAWTFQTARSRELWVLTGRYRWKPEGSNPGCKPKHPQTFEYVLNKLIIDNLTFRSHSKVFVQATAVFSTGHKIAVAGTREPKVTGKSKFDLIVDSEQIRPAECCRIRMFFNCQLLGNFV